MCHHHPDQPNVLSEKTRAEPTILALPVGYRHHTARIATALDISGHGEGIICSSGGLGGDVRAVSEKYSNNSAPLPLAWQNWKYAHKIISMHICPAPLVCWLLEYRV